VTQDNARRTPVGGGGGGGGDQVIKTETVRLKYDGSGHEPRWGSTPRQAGWLAGCPPAAT
jgi:hypothetical protein